MEIIDLQGTVTVTNINEHIQGKQLQTPPPTYNIQPPTAIVTVQVPTSPTITLNTHPQLNTQTNSDIDHRSTDCGGAQGARENHD
jgi:hypothetical protein